MTKLATFKTFFIILSLTFGIVLTVFILNQNDLPQKEYKSSAEKIVENYINLSNKKEFNDLETLTTSIPDSYKKFKNIPGSKERKSDFKTPKSKFKVEHQIISKVKLPSTASEVYQNWVNQEFPNIINEFNFNIKSIIKEETTKDITKVEVVLTDKKDWTHFAWTFLLIKENSEMKIFNITTPESAKDFLAKN